MTTNIDRRRFLRAAGGTAVGAAAAGVGGELLISKRYRGEASRRRARPRPQPQHAPPQLKIDP